MIDISIVDPKQPIKIVVGASSQSYSGWILVGSYHDDHWTN